MSTKITRFRNLLILALMCLVSGSVWGQGSETFENITSGVSNYNNLQNWTGDNGAAWATTKARTDQKINGTRGITFNAANSTITGNLTQEQQNNGVGIVTFLVQSLVSSDTGTMSFTVTAGSSSKDVTVNITGKGSPAVTATVELKSSDASSIIIKTNGKLRYTIDDISWTAYSNLEVPTFKFNGEASYTVILGETFTAPTLTNSSDATPTYESSDTNVATVNAETGEIEILGIGTTTITASVRATDIYAAATDSYILNVNREGEVILSSFKSFKGWPASGYPDEKEYSTENNMIWTFSGIYRANVNQEFHQIKKSSSNAYIITPKYSEVISSIKVLFTAGAGTITIKNIEDEILTTSTFISDKESIIDTKAFNLLQIKICITENGTSTAQMTTLEIYGAPEEPKSTIDPTTGAMTLTGTWTTEAVKALEIPANVTSVDMTAINVDVLPTMIGNPNCLFYVKENSTINEPNVVVGNNAIAIELHDGYDFYNTKSFTGDITYSRTFASGWNTFALPFNTAIPNGVQVEAFDKKDGNQILFTEATSIEANTAYLINVQAGGEISFSANNVTVPVTATTGDTYKSNFLHMTGDDIAGKYILVMEEGVEVFARANAEAQMHAFRGYLDLPAASGVQYSISHDGGATGINNTDIEGIKIYSVNGALIINADKTQSIQIYGLDGRMVKNIQVSEGENTVTGLAKGIYLINNQKAIIK